jgi:glycerol-3-phosphate acyltransferase PlsX
MGRIRGVSRPAIATVIPNPGSNRATVLLDAGANAECQPEWLVQFAQMGTVFARHRFGLDRPRVGLLSIGEENTKGNSLVKETHPLLERAPGVTFIGNVEGRDILTGEVDIVVTDGFSGNVVLKALEGSLPAIVGAVVQALTATDELASRFEVMRPAIDELYESLEPERFGGAMLLGVDGVCVISHGSSSSKAILNAIKVAREMVDEHVVAELRAAVALTAPATSA